MTDIYLDNLSYALGEKESTVKQSVEAGLTLTGAEAFIDAGFAKHWMAGPKTTAYDLCKKAVDPIRNDLTGIGAIIYSTLLNP